MSRAFSLLQMLIVAVTAAAASFGASPTVLTGDGLALNGGGGIDCDTEGRVPEPFNCPSLLGHKCLSQRKMCNMAGTPKKFLCNAEGAKGGDCVNDADCIHINDDSLDGGECDEVL